MIRLSMRALEPPSSQRNGCSDGELVACVQMRGLIGFSSMIPCGWSIQYCRAPHNSVREALLNEMIGHTGEPRVLNLKPCRVRAPSWSAVRLQALDLDILSHFIGQPTFTKCEQIA